MGSFKKLFVFLLRIIEVFLVYQIVLRFIRKRWHFPAPAFIGRFLDSDLRRKMQPPRLVVQYSGAKPGMQVLEIGCGSGAFTTHFARAVSPDGRVYALDIQPAMLEMLGTKLKRPEFQDIENIDLINQSAYQLPFEDGTLDLVYMITVLQEIPDQRKTLQEVKRVLRRGGILAVTELLLDPDYSLITTTTLTCEQAGFKLDAVHGNWLSYTVRFKNN